MITSRRNFAAKNENKKTNNTFITKGTHLENTVLTYHKFECTFPF